MRIMRPRGLTVILALCSVALLMGTGGAVRASSDSTVSIQGFAFQPGDLTIPAGSTVTWSNDQTGITHTVTSDDGGFDSGPLASGDAVAWEFDSTGVYAYHCAIHRGMTGTVTVV